MAWRRARRSVRNRKTTFRRRRNFRRSQRFNRRRRFNVRRLARSVRRLYKINEVKQVRSSWFVTYRPSSVTTFNQNVFVYPVTLPTNSLLIGSRTDSSFVGNTFQPFSLRIRHTLTLGGIFLATSNINPVPPYGCTVRVLVYQVKSGRSAAYGGSNDLGSVSYHEMAGSLTFNQDAFDYKRRVLGSPGSIGNAVPSGSQASDYFSEAISPLRVGFTRHATVLSDRKFTLSSMGPNTRRGLYRTRRPREVVYSEINPTVTELPYTDVDIPVVPTNAIYVMYLVTFDSWIVTAALSDTTSSSDGPSLSIASNWELLYRDA